MSGKKNRLHKDQHVKASVSLGFIQPMTLKLKLLLVDYLV